jgi:hypothetical protein
MRNAECGVGDIGKLQPVTEASRRHSLRIPHSGSPMPLAVPFGVPTLLIRKTAFERVRLTRQAIDERLNLTPDEFRVEGGLIAIGPIHGDEELTTFVEELERVGLVYFDDFFDLSGNWPEWLKVFVMADDS